MMHDDDAANHKQLFQGCDNSPPLNKNLVPRFRRSREEEEGTLNYRNLQDPIALLGDIESLHHAGLNIFVFEVFI